MKMNFGWSLFGYSLCLEILSDIIILMTLLTVVTVATVVTLVTVVTVVTVDRNKHVCKTLQQFVSVIDSI